MTVRSELLGIISGGSSGDTGIVTTPAGRTGLVKDVRGYLYSTGTPASVFLWIDDGTTKAYFSPRTVAGDAPIEYAPTFIVVPEGATFGIYCSSAAGFDLIVSGAMLLGA